MLWTVIILSWILTFQNSDLNTDRDGLAIQGYDPVSYFDGRPKEGSSEIKTAFEGATYYFISHGHKSQFLQNPEKYVPQYGGWCAYAMGLEQGEKVKIDPKTFKITDGKLYLFYNFWGSNTLKPWNENEAALMRKADLNWKKINER